MTNPIDPNSLTDELEGVRRLARTLARDEHEADDLVQDTMVAALQNRSSVRSGLGAWLSGVVRNLSRRRARSAGRRAKYEGQQMPAGAVPATADVIIRATEQSRVLDTLVRMEEPYRSAVLLRYIEGLPPRVIAKRMELPVETVRTHVKRGLERLRTRLMAAHGGHAGETRAALILAASETLGAGHARAVALARASGLIVLLALGLGVIWALGQSDGEPDSGATYLSEQDPALRERGDPERSRSGRGTESEVSADTPPSKRGDQPGSALAAPAQGPQALPPTPIPEPAEAPKQPASQPEVVPGGVPGEAPVVPIKEREAPAPHIAVENGEAGAAKKSDEEKAETEDEAGDEFYKGETSFSAKQVGLTIKKGSAWLLKRQGRNGSWGGIKFNSTYGGGDTDAEGMPAGPTALALYALLKSKVPADHPQVKRGFAWLKKNHYKPTSSYETSMLLLAITATADQDKLSATARTRAVKPKLKGHFRSWAVKLADHLIDKREGRGWRYNTTRGTTTAGGNEDLSSTQLAALSLFAAHRLGIRAKRKVWEDILAFSLEQQESDGPEVTYRDPVDPKQTRTARARGFAYIKSAEDAEESRARGGMTACGLANIEMARYVLTEEGKKWKAFQEREDAARIQEAIFDGLAWLDRNWSPFEDPQAERKNVYHIYWMYALERAMDLLDLKRLGNHNWYNEMGQELLNRQATNGHWATRGNAGGHDVLDTSFALLFLKRATQQAIPFGSVTGGSSEPIENR